MFQALLNELTRYVNGLSNSRDLEAWVVSHLQAILDSGDERAVELANEVDSLLIELGEGLATEADLLDNAQALVHANETVTVFQGQPADVVDEGAVAAESITTRWQDLGPVTNVHRKHSFA